MKIILSFSIQKIPIEFRHMGCIQSTLVEQSSKKKKSGAGKKGKKASPASATSKRGSVKASPKSVPHAETPNKKQKKVTLPPGPAKAVHTSNPLNFTKDEDKGGTVDRRSSVNSSSTASLRDLLATKESSNDPKQIEHTPLSDGKRKNMCVWIDSIDKAGLLDPQDYNGQQRREREIAGRQQQQPPRPGKRMSILMSFTTVEQQERNDQATGSVAVGQDRRSQGSDLRSQTALE
jgi:hypothetical protein